MKHRTRLQWGSTALAFGTVLTVLTGCTSPTDTSGPEEGTKDNPVTITFWDNNGGPSRTPVYEEIIKKFEAENPYITVDYVGIPAAEAAQKYETAVAGGSVPDIGVVNSTGGLSSLAAQDALVPLDDLLAESDLADKIAPEALAGAKDSSPDGNLYILPATQNSDVIWYRSDWFAEAGLDAPDTWSDFLDDAEALTDPSTGRYGFALRGGGGGTGQFVADMVACSGLTEFFDKDGKSTLDDPAVAKCVDQFAALYGTATSQADLSYTYPDMIAAFDGGSAAMVRHNLGSATNHLDAFGPDVALAAPMPKSDVTGKRTLVSSSADGPAIFSGSKHQDAAWKFVQFLLSHDSNSFWNQKAGQIPTNLDARSDYWVADSQQVSMAVETLSDPDTVVVTQPGYLPDWNAILTELAPTYQSVLLGDVSGKEFVATLAEQATAAQADYIAAFGGQ